MRQCRGKRIDKPDEWVYGWYRETYNGTPWINWWKGDMYNHAEVIPETVGESTGLKDRNGVEIFEGDIVHFVDPQNYSRPKVFRSVIKWFQEGCSYLCDEIGTGKSRGLHEFSMNSCEVISNVTDNPDLLEKS